MSGTAAFYDRRARIEEECERNMQDAYQGLEGKDIEVVRRYASSARHKWNSRKNLLRRIWHFPYEPARLIVAETLVAEQSK